MLMLQANCFKYPKILKHIMLSFSKSSTVFTCKIIKRVRIATKLSQGYNVFGWFKLFFFKTDRRNIVFIFKSGNRTRYLDIEKKGKFFYIGFKWSMS